MNLDSFIILELIPTNFKSYGGTVIQLSALKIKNMKLVDRFDYRLSTDKLPIPEMEAFINYDNDQFKYVNSDTEILDNFKKFIDNYPLLYIKDGYTKDFIDYMGNDLLNILDYLKLEYNKDIINIIVNKYNLEPSNHIVDLLYEALMFEY